MSDRLTVPVTCAVCASDLVPHEVESWKPTEAKTLAGCTSPTCGRVWLVEVKMTPVGFSDRAETDPLTHEDRIRLHDRNCRCVTPRPWEPGPMYERNRYAS